MTSAGSQFVRQIEFSHPTGVTFYNPLSRQGIPPANNTTGNLVNGVQGYPSNDPRVSNKVASIPFTRQRVGPNRVSSGVKKTQQFSGAFGAR